MRIAYFTLDEVNRFLVRRWLKEMRLTTARCGNVAVVILDLDFLPPGVGDWLQRVEVPTMVHGHNITEREACDLRKRGIRVCHGRVRKSVLIGWLGSVVAQPARAG